MFIIKPFINVRRVKHLHRWGTGRCLNWIRFCRLRQWWQRCWCGFQQSKVGHRGPSQLTAGGLKIGGNAKQTYIGEKSIWSQCACTFLALTLAKQNCVAQCKHGMLVGKVSMSPIMTIQSIRITLLKWVTHNVGQFIPQPNNSGLNLFVIHIKW